MAALQQDLAAERDARLGLEAEVEMLRLLLEDYAGGARPGRSARRRGAARRKPAAESRARRTRRRPPLRNAGERLWFDTPALLANGVPEPEIARLERLFEESELQVLYLRDRATREGWAGTPRFLQEMYELRAGLRASVGDETFDWLLYATQRTNRVAVRSVLSTGPAAQAGIRTGDLILRYDGKTIFKWGELQQATMQGEAGRRVPVEVMSRRRRGAAPDGAQRTARDPAGRGATAPVVEPLAEKRVKRLTTISAALALAAVAIRVHNALHYPADWGFDASFNWRYIYRLTQDWALPPPEAGWSTSDPPLFYYASAAVMRGLAALGARDAAVYAAPAALGARRARHRGARGRARAPGRARRPAARRAGGPAAALPAGASAHERDGERGDAGGAAHLVRRVRARRPRAGRAAGAPPGRRGGLASGLALLTKLSGAIAVATAVLTIRSGRSESRPPRARGPARRRGPDRRAAGRRLVPGAEPARDRLAPSRSACPRTWACSRCRPDERALADYLRVPLATFRDPQLLNPDLLRSVWGSTYVTVWFDGHRYFLPREGRAVSALGGVTLLLALLPTAAFAAGLARGAGRLRRGQGAADLPLLLLTALTLAGYAFYTWRNPWFAVVKGTSLLGLSLPFAFYASETLAGWLRGRYRRLAVGRPARARLLRRAFLYLRSRVREDRGVGSAVAAGGGR